MHSLATKLTIAFLAVGVIGVLLVAVITSVRTQQAFDQFLFGRSRPETEATLQAYYREHGNWENLNQALSRGNGNMGRGQGQGPPLATVADPEGLVVFGGGGNERIGTRVPARTLRNSVPIEVDGDVVGYLVFDYFGDRRSPDAPEQIFLRNLNRSILWASAGAAVVALILGAVLASTLTKPIRQLTAATQRIAEGELGIRVPVHTKDELGELTNSFNSMSADLEQASRLRRQMTADIAHDLRTPLSVILGYTEALSDAKLEATPEIADTLHREAQHLNHLVDDLRTLSLADAGELPLHRSLMSPVTLLERTQASYTMRAAQQDVEIHVNSEQGLPDINVDSQRMAQVLGNLVSNALRHTPADGTILLSARGVPGAVVLGVEDTGKGIGPEHLPHVFTRFYRTDRARTDSGESGLGLSIAKSIVEAHGGTIAVTSEPGVGAVFTIQLPAPRERAETT